MRFTIRWFAVLGAALLAVTLFIGSVLAQAETPTTNKEPTTGGHMHAQMDPALYARMIQRMNEVHGPEFTADMVQRMNAGETCHGAGMACDGPMGPGMMHGAHGGMMDGGMMDRNPMRGGMMHTMMTGVQNMKRSVGHMMGR